jgi:hypothetical protein
MVITTMAERFPLWRTAIHGNIQSSTVGHYGITPPFLIDTVKDETATLIHCGVIIRERGIGNGINRAIHLSLLGTGAARPAVQFDDSPIPERH